MAHEKKGAGHPAQDFNGEVGGILIFGQVKGRGRSFDSV